MVFGCLVLKLQRECKIFQIGVQPLSNKSCKFFIYWYYLGICSEGDITPEHWEESQKGK